MRRVAELKQLAVEVPDINALKEWPLLTVYGAGEFLDKPAPEMKWLVVGLLPSGVPSVMASKGGLGKSFLALQMCIALSTGKAFLDFDALPGPVACSYFGLEDSKDSFHRRFRSIVETYKRANDWTADDDENLRIHFSAPFINWQAHNATTFLPDLIPNLEHILLTNQERGLVPGLMVIDTLARVSEGDENTVAALRPVLTACNRIASYGYTPILLHHVGKGQDGAKGANQTKPMLVERMNTEWVRGSSSIVDNFRCIIQLAAIREDEADGAGLDTEKARQGGYLVMGTTKMNGGQKGDWRFLEQTETGAWMHPADGHESLAKMRGKRALTDLSNQMQLLLDIYKVSRYGIEPDRIALGVKYCAGAKDQKSALRSKIQKLRNAGLIQKNSNILTAQGLQRVHSMDGDTLPQTGDDNA